MLLVCHAFFFVRRCLVVTCWDRLISWLSYMWCFLVILSLSHEVSRVGCGTWLYWLLVFAFSLSFLLVFPVPSICQSCEYIRQVCRKCKPLLLFRHNYCLYIVWRLWYCFSDKGKGQINLTLKAPITTAAESKVWYFLRIVLLADDSHEKSCHICFLKNPAESKFFSWQIIGGVLRVKRLATQSCISFLTNGGHIRHNDLL